MGTKLYCGNLPYSITEDELRAVFEEVGPVVEVAVIIDRMTGRAKGFGFVTMENEQDAQTATEKVNGKEVGGRVLKVAEARPRQPREPRYDY